MINEKMTFADLKCFEEALHRKLTDNEAMLGYTKGFQALLEFIGMTEEKYMAYLQLLKLLVTYCTEDKIKFAKLRQSADYSDAFALLSDFIADCSIEDVPEKEGFSIEEDEESKNCEDSTDEDSISVDEIIEYFVLNLSEEETFWYLEYLKLDKELSNLKKFVQDLLDDEEEHIVEEMFSAMFDVVKQSVVEMTAAKLANDGNSQKLNKDLIKEVLDYIENNWTNYTVQIINDSIKIKKY